MVSVRLAALVAASLLIALDAPHSTRADRPAPPRHFPEAARLAFAHRHEDASAAVRPSRPLLRAQLDDADADTHARVWLPSVPASDDDADADAHVAHPQHAQSQSQVELSAYPPRVRDGEGLVVRWRGVAEPHAKDFVALTCGPSAGPHDVLHQLSAAPTADGDASVRFPALYQLRCNYSVTYYNYQPRARGVVALATLEVPTVDPPGAPKHGHLALSARADEMVVMYNSGSRATPRVRFGRDPARLEREAAGASSTYSAQDMCHAPANETAQAWFRDPGFMHKVVLAGLAPGARYFYRFGNDADGWSATFSFRAPPRADAPPRARFLAFADMGVDGAPAASSTAARAAQEVLSGAFADFVLHVGDVSYARGQGFVWDQFFHLVEPVAARAPYMVSVGNHEYDYVAGGARDPSGAADPATGAAAFRPAWGNFGADSSGECAVPMVHRWHAPETGRGLFWYSFDYGGVHVVQLSSEHDWTRGSEQRAWLERDLRAVDRARSPWVVLTAHRMMYTTQLGEEADLAVSEHFRAELEELLWTYKVNAVLVGHQHSYERSCAVRAGKCTPDGVGPVHLVIGSAGAALEREGFSRDIGEWSVAHVNDWGYLRVDASADAMTMQFVLNRDGSVFDEVTLLPWK